ncbi:MAG: glycosyl hydrolase, partial [Planctomycetia bacterium]|nr:glycosyl hydrolase [Planctomycetia bacterium]
MKHFNIYWHTLFACFATLVASVAFFTACDHVYAATSSTSNSESVQTSVTDTGRADASFVNPTTSRPWAYYWWLKGNVTPESITHDLEAMKAKGFGGILLFDSRRYYDDYESRTHVPVPLHIKHEFMSPTWRKLVVHTVKEANRLGLSVSMNIADSGGILRGPWELGANGPKELIWTQENIRGPKTIALSLDTPVDKKYYKDIGVFAVRIVSPVKADFEKEKLGTNWSNAVELTASSLKADSVIDLTPHVARTSAKSETSQLQWNVPKGNWKILRFGYHVIGDTGSVDILNKDAVT